MIETFVIVVLSIWAHELGHAVMARQQGDALAARRLTLRPWVNLDPIFSVLVPVGSCLLTGGAFAIGMGRPFLLSRPNWRILLAGPMVNLAIFGVCAMLYSTTFWFHDGIYATILHVATINYLLAIINLLPIKPLDGWGIYAQWKYRRVQKRRITGITDKATQKAVLGFTIPPEQ